MIKEGKQVEGIDMKGNPITGTVSSVLNTFQVAIVKIGNDRLETTEAYIKDLKSK